jgi:hypothetical protein
MSQIGDSHITYGKAAIFHDEKFSFRIMKNAGAEHQKYFSFPEISFRIAKCIK